MGFLSDNHEEIRRPYKIWIGIPVVEGEKRLADDRGCNFAAGWNPCRLTRKQPGYDEVCSILLSSNTDSGV